MIKPIILWMGTISYPGCVSFFLFGNLVFEHDIDEVVFSARFFLRSRRKNLPNEIAHPPNAVHCGKAQKIDKLAKVGQDEARHHFQVGLKGHRHITVDVRLHKIFHSLQIFGLKVDAHCTRVN